MKVIVGLGNPGHTYHATRHNMGFMVIQRLAGRHQASLESRLLSPSDGRPAAVHGEYQDAGETVRLLMPLTMMNESGEALRAAGHVPKELLIVCDDVNLPLGTMRLRTEGGAGGHHGLQSCLEALGTEAVARLRVGVAGGALPKELREYVLSAFPSTERPVVKQMVEQAADACELWSREGIERAMNSYNKAQDA